MCKTWCIIYIYFISLCSRSRCELVRVIGSRDVSLRREQSTRRWYTVVKYVLEAR